MFQVNEESTEAAAATMIGKVNEEGTEAAAATMIGMARITSVSFEPQPKRFIADHPFLYAILLRKRTLLFTGRMI
ncbi:unnamed protein product [Gongylonema pulchrum]|uniref:SERPIN domain-containing protein n=1 Tax=Gongylonema pulchrum TaxID=637853 RepID=A0A183DVR8_9BILA|nr:unnamed protein product [Gongylonema pulchrum]